MTVHGPAGAAGAGAAGSAGAAGGPGGPGGSARSGDAAGSDASVDWSALHAAAVEVMRSAYAPYSRFAVGVAGLVDDGRIVVGCNVENASYGVGLCAECGMVSQLHATGGGRLIAVWCVDARGETLMPCGRCRQLLWEHGGASCLLQTPRGIQTMADVLPQAFDATDITTVTDP